MKINLRLSLATTLHADGAVSRVEIEHAAAQHGISRYDLREAATSLGVEATGSVWRLPECVIPFIPRGGRIFAMPKGEAA